MWMGAHSKRDKAKTKTGPGGAGGTFKFVTASGDKKCRGTKQTAGRSRHRLRGPFQKSPPTPPFFFYLYDPVAKILILPGLPRRRV